MDFKGFKKSSNANENIDLEAAVDEDATVKRFVSPAQASQSDKSKTNSETDKVSARSIFTGMLRNYSDRHEALVGVDITPTHIRVCQMKKSDSGWKLTHMASEELSSDLTMSNMSENKSTYVETLKKLIRKSKVSVKNAAVAIPVANSIIKTITLPKMSDEDIEKAIEVGAFWQNLVQLPGDLEEYSVFYEVVKRSDDDDMMDILFVGSQMEDVNLYTDIIKEAGLNPTIVDVRCFALNNIFHVNGSKEDDAPVVFLKFGPDENYIHVIDKGESFLYDIYISDAERSTIMDHFNDAEILQRYATQAKQIISSHEIQHESSEKIKDIYVVSLMPQINTFVQKLASIITGYNVSECNFFDHIEIPEQYAAQINDDKNRSAWAVAMGLAVRKLDIFEHYKGVEGADNVNMLPDSAEAKKAKRIDMVSKISVVPLAVICLIIAIASYFSIVERDNDLGTKLSSLHQVDTLHQQKKAKLTKAQKKANALVSLEKIKADISSNQSEVLAAYQHINKVIPEGVWLTEMTFKSPNEMIIVGNSMSDQSILTFTKNLKDGGVFAAASLKTMHANKDFEGSSVIVKIFTLHCELEGLNKFTSKTKGGKK